MRRSIGEVIVNASAFAVLVEHIGHAAGKETKGGLGNTERLAHLVSLVGEDAEVQTELRRKLLLALGALSGDTDDVGLELLADVLNVLVETLGLDSAPGSGVCRIKVDNEGLLVLGAGEGLAVLVDEGEVGRSLSNGKVEGGVAGDGSGRGERRGGPAGEEKGGGLHHDG